VERRRERKTGKKSPTASFFVSTGLATSSLEPLETPISSSCTRCVIVVLKGSIITISVCSPCHLCLSCHKAYLLTVNSRHWNILGQRELHKCRNPWFHSALVLPDHRSRDWVRILAHLVPCPLYGDCSNAQQNDLRSPRYRRLQVSDAILQAR
jgi:hypothetical protein